LRGPRKFVGEQGPSARGGPALSDPRDLIVHCAQEMNHLAGFLAALFSRFANE
jgi:hypothetical protein